MATYGGYYNVSGAVAAEATMSSSYAEQAAYTAPADGFAILQVRAVLDANGILKIGQKILAANETFRALGVYVGPSQTISIDDNGGGSTTSTLYVSGVEFRNQTA